MKCTVSAKLCVFRVGRWVTLAAGLFALAAGAPDSARADKLTPPLPLRRGTLENHIDDLMNYLRSTDSFRRSQAERELMALGPKAKPAVPIMLEWLKDGAPERKQRACDILAAIGPEARPALPLLIKTLEGPDQAIKEHEYMTDSGLRLPTEVTSLHRSAVKAIGSIGPEAKDAVPALTKLLNDHKSHARNSAASSIRAITEDRAAVRTAFHEILKTPGAPGRHAAIRFFVEIGAEDAWDAIPALLEIARDSRENPDLASHAAFALWELARHKEAIPILLQILREGRLDLGGAEFLVRIGPDAKAAIPILIDKVKNFSTRMPTFTQLAREARVKSAGAKYLGQFGPDAKDAGDVLRQLLKHESPYVRIEAEAALWRIERSDTALAKLNEMLETKEPEVRLHVVSVLHELKRVPKAAGPNITELLRHGDFEIRDRAAELLKQITPDATKEPGR